MRLLAAAFALFAGSAGAVSPDLKVSTDDLNDAGEHAVEVQANKARGWPLQLLGEYSYGITDHWQAAVKLPFMRDDGLRPLGGALEVRYLGPHDRNAGAYWGIDVTAERERERRGDPYGSSLEVHPVLGTRTAGWHLAFNLPVSFPTSGPDRGAMPGVHAKAARRLGVQEVGVEYFREPGHPRAEYLFLAWDRNVGNPLKVGLGRGLTGASERWVVKVAYSYALSR